MSENKTIILIMRDGIFKTAPVSRKWHRVGRFAEREVDHGKRLTSALDEALRTDIINEIVNGELKGVVGIVRGGQLSILKGADLKSFADGITPDSRFAQDVLKSIKFICRGGEPLNSQALIDAVSHASRVHAEAMKAEMLGHANKKTDKAHLANVTTGFNDALKKVDYSETAREALFGSNRKLAKEDHAFNMNDNLLE